jgi:acyl-CoA synthetase (AMP-forming)/AMP-acid ligase II
MPQRPPQTFNFADIWEATADAVAEREAVVCGERRLTFAALEERANRLAHHWRRTGLEPGDFVGLYLPNATEYLEAMLAAWKLRAVPFNINHRYSANELAELVDDSGAAALVYDRALSANVAALGGRLEALQSLLAVDAPGSGTTAPGVPPAVDAATAYDEALAAQPADRPEVEGRSGDDLYVLYTGGTTGRPKGVVWRMEDAFYPCFGGGDPMRANPVERPEQILDHLSDFPVCYLCIAPMMHAAGQWVTFSWLWAGCRVVLVPGSLDPAHVWSLVEQEKANLLTVVGDAVGKPLLDAWDANPGRWDISSLFAISNGGAPMSPTLRLRISSTFPGLPFTDGYGSSETGAQGSQRHEPGAPPAQGVARFAPYGDDTAVLTDDLRRIAPGSGEVGRVALTGRIPLRYHNAPEKTAETFVLHEGRRWVLTGDLATVCEDGTIEVFGRGSLCINTGGEKVFGEEVEMVLHGHPAVTDVVVVGAPDERWGETVCAVVVAEAGSAVDLAALQEHARKQLAGYKLPRRLVLVDEIRRSPAGKADYRWARQIASGSHI